MSNEERLATIQYVREKNNRLWMNILRIALLHAPDVTKECLREIRENDVDVATLLKEIADD